VTGYGYPAPQLPVPHAIPRVAPKVPASGKLLIGSQALDPVVGLGGWLTAAGLSSVGVYNQFTPAMGSWWTTLLQIGAQAGQAMVTWNFPGSQGTQASIAAGVDDAYITQCAQDAANWGWPIFCRPNWEMNGWWYNWSPFDGSGNARTGCAPTDYIAAWQHYRSIFASIAPNVSFIWCPHLWIQFKFDGSASPYVPTDMYPGDAYVDWIGMDAYGGAADWTYMQTGQGYGMNNWAAFATSHSKPLMLCEWALSDGATGDSPTWMSNLTGWMDANLVTRAAVYFEFNNGAGHNYVLESLPNSAAAFRSWLSATPSRFITSVPRSG
jgi:hypothetical protein